MKHKFNIPALFLALLFVGASNGLAISEHICSSSGSHDISLFSKAGCSCSDMTEQSDNDCCKNNQYFSKYVFDGLTSKVLQIEPVKIIPIDFTETSYIVYIRPYLMNEYSGIPPPDNLAIKHIFRPTPEKLSLYRC